MADFVEGLRRAGIRAAINVCGTPSAYGALGGSPEVVEAVARTLPLTIDMVELQRLASATIASTTGAEAGYVTGCSAAALVLTVAACMTGDDPALVARLPDDREPRQRVVVQAAHDFSCGAPLAQLVAITGARLRLAGGPQGTTEAELTAALDAGEAIAVLHVEGAGTPGVPLVPLDHVATLARDRGLPVIVDGAAEHDLRGAVAHGADLFICSAQKIHRGPTAGLVAGRRDLVRACYLQETGIGRAMKAGKEAIAGAIAALDAWATRDDSAEREAWRRRFAAARDALVGLTAWLAAGDPQLIA